MLKPYSKYLEWDSKFFEKKIYRLDIIEPIKKEEFPKLINEVDGDLIYIFSKSLLDSEYSEKLFLVDKKVIYHKEIKDDVKNVSSELDIVSAKKITNSLLEIALLSGHYSRFKLDKKLNHKFYDLYKIWLEGSLSRRLATEVLVCKIDNEEVGFVTIKANEKLATIGLIAVNSLFHGKNIGTVLIQKVEKWCLENCITSIEVATQLDNKQACKFYEKNGFAIKQIDYIYHYYKN